ncbi:MAG: DUF167 domain-containing protein [Candidatus Theseobacter exili]|nr:DUF167 domain-containing protein [Candidatus Theseobacter exili]
MTNNNNDGIVVSLRVQPGSKQQGVEMLLDGTIKVRLQAPPVEGKANKALIDYLSKLFGIKKSAISIHKGEKSRNKKCFIYGISQKYMVDTIKENA